MNRVNLSTIKLDPLSVKVGDVVHADDGKEYSVTKITYDSGYNTLGIITFECDALLHYPPLESDVFMQYNNRICFRSLWPRYADEHEEEISDETREEFIRLLM